MRIRNFILLLLLNFTQIIYAQNISFLGADTATCSSVLSLDAGSGLGYMWSTGDTTRNIQVLSTGNYSVTVSTIQGVAIDTIHVSMIETPVVGVIDTTLCGGDVQLTIPGIQMLEQGITWYLKDTSSTAIGYGATLDFNVNKDTSLWVEPTMYSLIDSGGMPITSNMSILTSARDGQGLRFDAYQSFVLHKVFVGAVGRGEITVGLLDAQGVILAKKTFGLKHGTNELILDFDVPAAAGLELVKLDGTTVLYTTTSGLNYPYTINQFCSINEQIINARVSNTLGYSYFYNWHVAKGACVGARVPFNVFMRETPLISLPEDTLVCNSFIELNASSSLPNIKYLWGTGDTTSSLEIRTSGVYPITTISTQTNCKDSVAVNVVLSPTLNLPAQLDTMICEGTYELGLGIPSAEGVAWYSSISSPLVINLGETIRLVTKEDTTFWVEARSTSPMKDGGFTYDPGLQNITYASTLNRGLRFDALQSFLLEELTVVALNAGTLTIEFYNRSGTFSETRTFKVNAGENILPLGIDIPKGNDYSIVNKSTVPLHISRSGFSFPYVTENILEIKAQVVSRTALRNNTYPYFYNWKISRGKCVGPRVPFNVEVVAYPDINLPEDTILCNNPTGLTLDAQNTGATYLWSTGDTTQQLTVNTTDFYTVTVTNEGLCASVDGMQVQYATPPSFVSANDTTICSTSEVVLGTAGTNGILAWSNTVGLDTLIGLDAPFTYFAEDTTKLYLTNAARGNFKLGELQLVDPNTAAYFNFGIADTFTVEEFVILDAVAVYTNQAPTTLDIVLRDKTGKVIGSQSATITQAFTKTSIPLGFQVAPGTGYSLSFANLSGGALANVMANYPYRNNRVHLNGNSIGTENTYFFDWSWTYAVRDCRAAMDSMLVTVKHPLDLPDTVFTCNQVALDAFSPLAQYTWSTGETSPQITATQSGTYSVTITDGLSCSASDSTVVQMPEPVGLTDDGQLCGTTLSTTYDSTTTNFLWSDGSTFATLDIATPGTYWVEITTPENCVLRDSTQITSIEILPTLYLGADTTVCEGYTLNGGTYDNYSWSTGAASSSITIDTTGQYVLNVTSNTGCSTTDTIFIAVDKKPVADFTFIQNGTQVSFDNEAQGAFSFLWNFGDGNNSTLANPFHIYTTAGNYTVRLIVTNNCGADTTTQQVLLVSTQKTMLQQDIQLFPNPNTGTFTLQSAQAWDESQIRILNILGQTVYTQHVAQHAANTPFTLTVDDLPAGTYFIQWQSAAAHWQETLHIQR